MTAPPWPKPRTAHPRAAALLPGGRRRRSSRGVWLGVAAWLAGLFAVTPILWMLLTSFHSEQDAAQNPPSLAADLTLESYRTFFGSQPLPAFVNSFSASLVSTALVLALSVPAAYALSIKPVPKWSDVMFFFLSTKFLPIVAGLLPLYLFALHTGTLDNIWLLSILYTSMNLAVAVWMMRSFLSEVPREIIEAAQLDGASLTTTLVRVVGPIAIPGIAATALICFIFSWNELMLARTLTATVASTAPVFMTSFLTSQGLFIAKMSAACIAISLPVLAAGFAAQDKLVQGLSMGAVK
ncbi:carbohydrate ABC transporter permease [Phycicoccus endophyticus]|uniref:Carbohydrate ABC transporter permease n=1 Tax=Phycicoccus endophyticus TaxID=1690220 RepID=A0A7G9R1L6_9MICO|nr:carbohydrate ABC transporter permease [Phycicoccus endophyticus]NHI18721.1 carbohydrate ABC transporter permease [Phycicoccus endophyticus]QNN49491.1 carbohydrate ABC transporter permease [Phycicoccus endophyticus]GGL36990.1 mannitol ABC transporter permease [Phycicoccus endophyticus]